jgi:hypothetical protein
MAAGLVLILNVHAGLYVLIAPVLAALAGGVINARLFLTRITNLLAGRGGPHRVASFVSHGSLLKPVEQTGHRVALFGERPRHPK